MTGFGQASVQSGAAVCAVEIRTVNNRFLKVHAKLPEQYSALENRLEKLIRDHIRRGVVSMAVRWDGGASVQPFRINVGLLRHYLAQLREAIPAEPGQLAAALLPLPGVVEAAQHNVDLETDWTLIEEAATAACEQLQAMRRSEGSAMRDELADLGGCIGRIVDEIDGLAERSVVQYRDRLCERVSAMLAGHDVGLEKGDLLRELTILAERFDIAEEIVRLRSHGTQLRAVLDVDDSVGRKLDFLTQELHREANTIGSKANDLAIVNLVVELKTRIERVREIVQNVE